LQQTYANVPQEDFNTFGIYLGELGYTLPNYEYVGESALAADVVKDDIAFKIQYDWNLQQLIVVYPEGVRPQRIEIADPFAGYTVLVEGNFDRSFFPFSYDYYFVKVNSGKVMLQTTKDDWKRTHSEAGGAYVLNVAYWNQSAYGQDMTYLVSNVSFHYITDQGHTRYTASCVGVDETIAPSASGQGYWWIDNASAAALFNRDGITAVTFNVLGYDTPFVIYVHNPNEDLREPYIYKE